jgi:hypothetical protein
VGAEDFEGVDEAAHHGGVEGSFVFGVWGFFEGWKWLGERL